jgi:8-oxo-dGTP pyrophosphatase MutT (NUDIX family)
MRRSEGALALVRRERPGRTEYLVQWNEKWQAYNFVGGHRRAEETFIACLERELGEELNLHRGGDYRVKEGRPWHLEYTTYSESARAETAYVMELFPVELMPAAAGRVEGDPANCWVSGDEVRQGRAGDGRPVSRTVALLLEKAGLLGEVSSGEPAAS